MGLGFLKKDQPTREQVATEVRVAIAQMAEDDKELNVPLAEVLVDEADVESDEDHTGRVTGSSKLSQLIDADFPFDESQVSAVEGMVESQYGCLTGAAGTGKTTVTKKLVDRLLETTAIGAVDMRKYWKSGFDDDTIGDDFGSHASVNADDYEFNADSPIIPSVVLCAFTGRASQQIKGNFPRDWHGNIMTIHRLLGFYPEPYEDFDPEWVNEDTGVKEGRYVTKRRFVPTYTADFKMPWDIICIDEAGMLGLELWHQLLAATKPGCRIYMIGDINQLPPVHGKSIFGFALAKWPAFELTHVHRQQGKDNPIVDNAWRVIHGQMPVSGGRFQMIPVQGDANLVSRKVRAMMPKLKSMDVYDPIRDTIITPINGEDGAKGYALGQLPLNREFALMFNSDNENPRYLIDGGRVKQRFAVGDKVMATKNDWEAGITNGMTGIIESITEHGGYQGDRDRFGPLHEIAERLKAEDAGVIAEHELVSLDELADSFAAVEEGAKNKKEKRERGPSSHIVTVRFGSGEHSFALPFGTLAEVGSLMTAYVVTCHKMQGGEAPTIVIIVHDAHRAMLYREWLYTAITRASEKCILIYSESALKIALNKQNIKGRTLKEKVKAFNELMNPKGFLDAAKLVELPECESRGLAIMDREERLVATPSRLTTEAEKTGGLAGLVQKARVKIETKVIKEVHVHVHHHESTPRGGDVRESDARPDPIDGGELRAHRVPDKVVAALPSDSGHAALPVPAARLVPLVGVARVWERLRGAIDGPLLLTHQPLAVCSPEPEAKAQISSPAEPQVKKSGLSFLKSKKG